MRSSEIKAKRASCADSASPVPRNNSMACTTSSMERARTALTCSLTKCGGSVQTPARVEALFLPALAVRIARDVAVGGRGGDLLQAPLHIEVVAAKAWELRVSGLIVHKDVVTCSQAWTA